MKTVNFLGVECIVDTSKQYGNGRIAIELIIKDTGEPMCRASANVPSIYLEPGEIIIKNYSENTGVLECLVMKSIVELIRYEYNWPIVKLIEGDTN